jgi:hypothetical protein
MAEFCFGFMGTLGVQGGLSGYSRYANDVRFDGRNSFQWEIPNGIVCFILVGNELDMK